MKQLSFVLPLRNEEMRAKDTIESLLSQTVPVPIIIINDGSTDRTSEILNKYKNNPLIDVYTNDTHYGGAYSRNLGNRMATSNYVGACDSDIYYKNHAEVLLRNINETQHDVYYTKCDLHKNGLITHFPLVDVSNFFDNVNGFKKMPIRHMTTCYRREIAIENPYPEISLETDCFEYFFLNLLKLGYSFKGIDESTLMILRGTTNRDKRSCENIRKDIYAQFGMEFSR